MDDRCELLLSADDRTGALEVGGLVACEKFSVPVGPAAADPRCAVVDIATRHLTIAQACNRMERLIRQPAQHRAHKMDAGLRGNWPAEIDVMLRAGMRIAVVCSYPDAGRRCLDGVVYIHDLPVLESVFGKDPLNAPVSSRPAEVLEHAGVRGDVVVWDANDNAQMAAAIKRARAEDRIVVGASGALGAFAETVFPNRRPRKILMPGPVVVLCGSLNPLSRTQIQQIGEPIQRVSDQIDVSRPVVVLGTAEPSGTITDAEAENMALVAAQSVERFWPTIGTLIVVGGDTAAAVVGDDTLQVMGTVAPGIPASTYRGLSLITKGGGIGSPGVLKDLVSRSR